MFRSFFELMLYIIEASKKSSENTSKISHPNYQKTKIEFKNNDKKHQNT